MATNKLTIVAELVDHMTGPTKKATRAVEDMGEKVQSTGKQWKDFGGEAEKSGKRAERSTSKVDRAVGDLLDSTRRVGREWNRAWDGTERGPQKAADALSRAGRQMVTESQSIGQRVGRNISTGVEKAINNIDVSGLEAALGGVTVVGGIAGSLDRDTMSRQLAAASGADPGQMRALTDAVYGEGFGQDYASVGLSAGSLVATLEVEPGSPEAEALLRGNVTLADAFQLDPDQLTMAARIIADNDDISAGQAQALLAETLQGATAQGRDEFLDNLQEYVPLLNDTGISARALAVMMSEATSRGHMQSDRLGDAVKEFTVRAVDTGSKTYSDAYGAIGLDQSDISRRLQSGDATAMTDVARALAALPDEADRANLAKEIFGTPLEDQGVGQINDQIAAWAEMDLTISGADDTLKDMEDTMSSGPGADWRRAMRDLSGAMIDVGDAVAPLISALAPVISFLAKPIAAAATGLTIMGILSRIPGGAAAAKWALRGLWRVFMFTPLGRAVGIIMAVGTGLKWLYDNVEPVRDAFDWLAGTLEGVFDKFAAIGDKIDQLVNEKFPALNSALKMGDGATAEDDRNWGERVTDAGGAFGYWLGLPDLTGQQEAGAMRFHERGFATGGYTGDIGTGQIAGAVHGREFVTNAWATAKLRATHPGALEHMNRTGTPPVVQVPGAAPIPSIAELHVHTNATDGATFARQFEAEWLRKAREQSLTYATPTARGAY